MVVPIRSVRGWLLWALLVSTLMGMSVARAHSEAALSTFIAANNLYDEGKFSEAAQAYEKILASGRRSAALYFNLGNALFKSAQIGSSIAAYRNAERLAPRDPDIRANLRFAQNQVQGPTLRPSALDVWLGRLTLNEWAVAATVAFWLFFVLLILVQLRPQLRRSLRTFLVLTALAALLLASAVGYTFYQHHFVRLAVITLPDVVIRQRPVEASPNGFTVHDGAEMRVLNEKDDWLQVSPDPSRIGWVRRDQVVLSSS